MLGKERTDVYCDNNTKHTNTLCGKMQNLLVLQQAAHVVKRPNWETILSKGRGMNYRASRTATALVWVRQTSA
jgi:translation initiation factor IF-1